MSSLSAAERLLAEQVIAALNLEAVSAEAVAPDAPLFGQAEGSWGLDSIDALEIALAVQQQYGVEIRSEDEAVKRAFASIRALSAYVEAHRKA
jgi:acyl carrier protein